MKSCDNIRKLADELKLQRKLLYTWKSQLEGPAEPRRANLAVDPAERLASKLREENQRLKQALAEKTLEVDFFKGALRRMKEGRRNNSGSGASASTQKSRRGRSSSKAN